MKAIIAALAVVAGFCTSSAEIRYHLAVVRPFERFQPSVADLNNAREMSWLRQEPERPVLWAPGIGETVINLPFQHDTCTLFGFNNLGAITGTYSDTGPTQSYFWSRETGAVAMGTPSGLDTESVIARDVNDSNVVVGSSLSRPFTWTVGGGYKWLRALGTGSGQALAINNNGQVAGFSVLDSTWQACVWMSDGRAINIGFPPGFVKSYPRGISDSGSVIGICVKTMGHDGPHAFIWDNGAGMTFIRGLSATVHADPKAINGSDVVVGNSGNRAFVFDRVNGVRQLDTVLDSSSAGWVLFTATSINDSGQIVGRGRTPQGQTVLYIATPVEQ